MALTTREKALADLAISQAEKAKKLQQEYDILEALPPELAERVSVYVHSLYGSIGTIALSHDFFDYSNKSKQPTLDDVLALAAILPPIPLVKVSDGCTSLQPTEYRESLPDDKRRGDELPIIPFHIKIEHNAGKPIAAIEWESKLNGAIVSVCVKLSLHNVQKVCNLSIYYDHARERFTRCDLTIGEAVTRLFSATGDRLADSSRIRWGGSGDMSYQNFTVYWVSDYVGDSDKQPTLGDLVRQLR